MDGSPEGIHAEDRRPFRRNLDRRQTAKADHHAPEGDDRVEIPQRPARGGDTGNAYCALCDTRSTSAITAKWRLALSAPMIRCHVTRRIRLQDAAAGGSVPKRANRSAGMAAGADAKQLLRRTHGSEVDRLGKRIHTIERPIVNPGTPRKRVEATMVRCLIPRRCEDDER